MQFIKLTSFMLFRTKFLKLNVIYVQLKIEFKLSKGVPEPKREPLGDERGLAPAGSKTPKAIIGIKN